MNIRSIGTIVVLTSLLGSSLIFGNTLLENTLLDRFGIPVFSMGDAGVAHVEGAYSLGTNPAGLASHGVQYIYENLDMDNTNYNPGLAHSVFFGPFGYAYLEKKSDQGDVQISSIGLAKKGDKSVDWGVAFKAVKSTIGVETQSGWSSDIGLMARFSKTLTFGLAIHDWAKQNVEASPSVVGGFALSTPDHDLTFCADLAVEKTSDTQSYSQRYGFEYEATKGFILRGGWRKEYLTAGIQLSLPIITVSYASLYPSEAGQSAVHMLGVSFGGGAQKAK